MGEVILSKKKVCRYVYVQTRTRNVRPYEIRSLIVHMTRKNVYVTGQIGLTRSYKTARPREKT